MKYLILLAFLTSSCLRVIPISDNEAAIHLRMGGKKCFTQLCGLTSPNMLTNECADLNQFELDFMDSMSRNTKVNADQLCSKLKGWNIIMVKSDDHGAFKLGPRWFQGATSCESRLTFVGLPAGNKESALAHEMIHATECTLGISFSPPHSGWEDAGFCKVVDELSNRPDSCNKD